MKNRPYTTLFLLESVDGKISTGETDDRDVDKDFPLIKGVKEGLYQYYDIEKTTDAFSLNSGRVMAKIGCNTRTEEPAKMGCSFIIIDNKPHLNEKGVMYLSKWVKKLFLVTSNKKHPAYEIQKKVENIEIIEYEIIDFEDLLIQLRERFGVERLTIQSGGTLNSRWIRLGLIDRVSVVIAPVMIGGANTQSLMGGESLKTFEDLKKVKALKLASCEKLKHSYVRLEYDVINETEIRG